MPETAASSLDPNITPRLRLRRPNQTRRIEAAVWGIWGEFGDRPMLVTNGLSGTVTLRLAIDGEPAPHGLPNGIEVSRSPMNLPGGPPPGRTFWGAFGQLGGVQMLAVGASLGGGDRETAELWLWKSGDDRFVPVGDPHLGWQSWGAWGQIDGRLTLATGGQDDKVHLWAPESMEEYSALDTAPVGRTTWGAWGQVNGEPVLAVGGETGAQLWSSSSLLPDGSTTSLAAGQPTFLPSEATVWGAWGQVDGEPVLAIGYASGLVRLFNAHTRGFSTVQFDLLTSTSSTGTSWWGAWGSLHGAPVLMISADSGEIWFCDPATDIVHQTAVEGPLVWATWGVANDKPTLATGDTNGRIRFWDLTWQQAVPRVPRYSSDISGAVDLLGRRNDAAALADLITARSARPPLAVGLFGEWGAGKSTFLDMLQQQVAERARTAGANDPIAHGQVRQVRFNAWHYAEADLWASMVAELFAQLSEGTDPAQEQRQQSRLASELVQARGLRERLVAAQARLGDLEDASVLGPGQWSTLPPDEQKQLLQALGPEAQRTYDEAVATLATGQASWRFWMGIARALPRKTWLLVSLILAIAVGLAVWGPGLWHWLATLPVIGAIGVVAAGAKPVLDRLKGMRQQAGKVWQQVKGIRDKEQHRLQTAKQVAAAEVAELKKRLQNLTSAGQLAGAVQDRAGLATYRERLGLMTEIRRDFELMAGLLRSDEAERRDLPLRDAAGDELPAIDRVVIYIDDLDRCPPDRVVDVLEAVHLLLAVRLFVVVVAVDPRWLLRSLKSHYRELFEQPAGDNDEQWASTPAQYLEKIFQIMLTLPPMSQDGYQQMIQDLVGKRPEVGTPSASVASPAPSALPEPVWPPTPPSPETRIGVHYSTPSIRLDAPIHERVDPLALTPDEYKLINLLGPPLVTGPRSVKRLANSYGLLVATRSAVGGERPDLEPVDDLGGSVALPYRAGMVLLAAVIGYPSLGPEFFPALYRTAADNPRMSWQDYLAARGPGTTDEFLRALAKIAERADLADLPLPRRLSIWADWVIPVGRLSFPTGSSVARLMGQH